MHISYEPLDKINPTDQYGTEQVAADPTLPTEAEQVAASVATNDIAGQVREPAIQGLPVIERDAVDIQEPAADALQPPDEAGNQTVASTTLPAINSDYNSGLTVEQPFAEYAANRAEAAVDSQGISGGQDHITSEATGNNEADTADDGKHTDVAPGQQAPDRLAPDDTLQAATSGADGPPEPPDTRSGRAADNPEDGEAARRTYLVDEQANLIERAANVLDEHDLMPEPYFGTRMSLALEQLQTVAEQGEQQNYFLTSGDYSAAMYGTATDEGALTPLESTHEQMIHGLIDQQLAELEPDSNQPVVALDIGGRGVSWSQYAEQYADLVDQGKVVFVVSNLFNQPEDWPARIDRLGSQQTEDFDALLARTRASNRVQFVQSTFSGLPEVVITLPDGRTMPLRNAVTILHDANAMTEHSQIPEVDILAATQVIAPNGTYLVPSDEVHRSLIDASPKDEARQGALYRAYEILQAQRNFHLTRTPRGSRTLGWHIFHDQRINP